MATALNWLHLSDLHFGHDDQKPLWPTFKTEFYRDMRSLIDQTGPLDIVFFSGDFVHNGSEKQFAAVAVELENLWKEFEKIGSSPVLLSVPGNHDLLRPVGSSPVAVALD